MKKISREKGQYFWLRAISRVICFNSTKVNKKIWPGKKSGLVNQGLTLVKTDMCNSAVEVTCDPVQVAQIAQTAEPAL